MVAVGAQLISGSPGLGSLLVNSQNASRNDIVWACLVVTGTIGVIINLLLSYLARVLERRLNRTRVSSAGREGGAIEDTAIGGVLPMETAPGGAIMR